MAAKPKTTTPPEAAPLPVANSCGAPCAHWKAKGSGYGICKRFPPTPLVGAGCSQPTTTAEDWCGEFHPVPDRQRRVGFVEAKPCPGCGAPLLQACADDCPEMARRIAQRAGVI